MNKTCDKCKQLKDINLFSKNKYVDGGYKNWCKNCEKLESQLLAKRYEEMPIKVDKDICSICKHIKNIKDFCKSTKSKKGYKNYCNSCNSLKQRSLRKLNGSKINRASKEKYQTFKKMLVDSLGGKCVKCGYDKCLKALDFHHLNRLTKIRNVSEFIVKKKYDEAIQESTKCILLCRNCHAEVEDKINNT